MTYDLGKFAPTFRGPWSGLQTYNAMDVVTYNGNSWISRQANNSNHQPPTTTDNYTTYWYLFAKGGEAASLTPADIQTIVQQIMEQDVIVDSGYSAFKQETKEAIENMQEPGNGQLIIKRNNVQVGVFTANQSTNTNINITVPTTVRSLTDSGDFQVYPAWQKEEVSFTPTLNTIYHPQVIKTAKVEFGLSEYFELLKDWTWQDHTTEGYFERFGALLPWYRAKGTYWFEMQGDGVFSIPEGYFVTKTSPLASHLNAEYLYSYFSGYKYKVTFQADTCHITEYIQASAQE